uniref:Xylulose kinase-1 n=1 Tax=Tanacetum cinerariifolium TaxID=118510 RepID=A0A6L2MEZ5_TANCI|nr:hypothetical protein [Tanacetum cinerariifolium]
MVAYLEKSDDNTEFHQIVDFLSSRSITYALTVSPTIYAFYIKQFWNTATSKTVNSVKQIHAIVDGKAVVISKSLVRSDLLFDDEDGITCLTNDEIFENLALIGYEPLSTKITIQKGNVTLLFNNMLVQKQAPECEGLAIPPEPQPKPSILQPPAAPTLQSPTTYKRQRKTYKRRRTQKANVLPQTNVPQNLRADEVVNQEKGDRGIDTCGSPRRQETIAGTSTQTRSERVIKQPNEPPLIEGHTYISGKGRLEENIELTDTIDTSYDSPLTGGYTPGSDEGRITLAELIETYTTLSNRVTQLETELSTTKVVYHKAFITLTNRVKKLESQLKQKRSSAVIYSSDEEGPSETTEHSRDDDDDETLAETLLNIKKSSTKDKGKGIMQETNLPKKLKKKEMIQLSLDEELTQKLYAEELAKERESQEQERYNLEKALELQRQLDQRKENVPKGDQAKEIDWNDPQVLRYHALQNRPFSKAEVRKNMIMYLKNNEGYKQSYFKGMKVGFDLHQGSSKKHRLDQQTKETDEEAEAQGDSDQEVEELKLYMRIILEEDIAIEAIPLAIKPLVIIEYKILKEGKIKTYHITRADGSTRRHTLMINLLENINREDLETLWKLVKDKYGLAVSPSTGDDDNFSSIVHIFLASVPWLGDALKGVKMEKANRKERVLETYDYQSQYDAYEYEIYHSNYNIEMEDNTMYHDEYGDQYFHPSYGDPSFINQTQGPTQQYYYQGKSQGDNQHLSFDVKYDKLMSMIESKKEENKRYEASFTTHEASFAALETHVDRLLDQLNRDETYKPQDFDDEDEGEEQNEEFTLYLTNTMEWSTISSHKDKEDGYNTDDHNNSLHDPNLPVKGHHEESFPLKVKEEVAEATTTPYLKTLKEIILYQLRIQNHEKIRSFWLFHYMKMKAQIHWKSQYLILRKMLK